VRHLDLAEFRMSRAILTLEDPDGELDAVVPLTRSRAMAIVELGTRHVDRAKLLAAADRAGDLGTGQAYRDGIDALVAGSLRPRPRRTADRPGRRIDDAALVVAIGADPSASAGMVVCPGHVDEQPSLSWRRTPERVLIHCFAGCTFEEILAAVGVAS
jgi:hypothetical protein